MATNPNTAPRHIQVHSSVQISPHMQRIYFCSGDFSDFPLDEAGAHIKLFFPEQPKSIPLLPYRNDIGIYTFYCGYPNAISAKLLKSSTDYSSSSSSVFSRMESPANIDGALSIRPRFSCRPENLASKALTFIFCASVLR